MTEFKILISTFLSEEFKKDLAKRKKMGNLDFPEIFNNFSVSYFQNGKLSSEKKVIELYYYVQDGWIWHNDIRSKKGAKKTLLLKYLEFK